MLEGEPVPGNKPTPETITHNVVDFLTTLGAVEAMGLSVSGTLPSQEYLSQPLSDLSTDIDIAGYVAGSDRTGTQKNLKTRIYEIPNQTETGDKRKILLAQDFDVPIFSSEGESISRVRRFFIETPESLESSFNTAILNEINSMNIEEGKLATIAAGVKAGKTTAEIQTDLRNIQTISPLAGVGEPRYAGTTVTTATTEQAAPLAQPTASETTAAPARSIAEPPSPTASKEPGRPAETQDERKSRLRLEILGNPKPLRLGVIQLEEEGSTPEEELVNERINSLYENGATLDSYVRKPSLLTESVLKGIVILKDPDLTDKGQKLSIFTIPDQEEVEPLERKILLFWSSNPADPQHDKESRISVVFVVTEEYLREKFEAAAKEAMEKHKAEQAAAQVPEPPPAQPPAEQTGEPAPLTPDAAKRLMFDTAKTFSALIDENADLRRQRDKLDKVSTTLNQDNQHLRLRVDKLVLNLDNKNQENSGLRSTNILLEGRVSDLETQNAGLRGQVEELITRLNETSQESAGLRSANTGLKDTVDTLETQNKNLDGLVDELRRVSATLNVANQHLTSQTSGLVSKLDNANQESSRLRTANASLESTIGNLASQIKKLSDELAKEKEAKQQKNPEWVNGQQYFKRRWEAIKIKFDAVRTGDTGNEPEYVAVRFQAAMGLVHEISLRNIITTPLMAVIIRAGVEYLIPQVWPNNRIFKRFFDPSFNADFLNGENLARIVYIPESYRSLSSFSDEQKKGIQRIRRTILFALHSDAAKIDSDKNLQGYVDDLLKIYNPAWSYIEHLVK